MTLLDQREIFQSWESLVFKGKLLRTVREPIMASWVRCHKRALDPFTRSRTILMHPGELKALLTANEELLTVASPMRQELAQVTNGSGFLLMLTDAQGRILDIDGDAEHLKNAASVGLNVGCSWSEEDAGTNAISLALINQSPFQVIGCEHYVSTLHRWTCSAVPLANPHGQTIGSFSISGPAEFVHPHTLGMVVSAGRAIERQLGLIRSNAAAQGTNKVLDVVLGAMRDSVFVTNRDGSIIKMNACGRDLLSQTTQGTRQNLLNATSSAQHLHTKLAAGAVFDDEEVFLRLRGQPQRYVMAAKPVKLEGHELSDSVVITLQPARQADGPAYKVRAHPARFTLDDIVGHSPLVYEMKRAALRAAGRSSTVLLLGESGTGKELMAQGIHNASNRRDGPFVALNCSAIPRTLLESELFGYEPGAFTDAVRKGRPGKFELADGGTLLLDEIGDMSSEMQAALLRVLQEKEVVRLGGTRPIRVNVRVIAATNHDLYRAVQEGRFRGDLFYRLDVLTLRLPALREHVSDVPLLVDHFLTKQGAPLAQFSAEAMELLLGYHWPGNVRELENVIEKCLSLDDDGRISVSDLPGSIRDHHQMRSSHLEIHAHRTEGSPAGDERQRLCDLIRANEGNLSRVAKALGISRPTLYRKIRIHGLDTAKYQH